MRLEPVSPNWNHVLDCCNTNYIWTGAIALSIRGGSNSLAATAAMLIVIFATKMHTVIVLRCRVNRMRPIHLLTPAPKNHLVQTSSN